MKSKITINRLSKSSSHLFWEYNLSDIDYQQHKNLIIIRVLEYGNDEDWNLIKNMYSIPEIKEAAISARSLDEVAMHFISIYTNTPLTKFRCYTRKQSAPHFSGY